MILGQTNPDSYSTVDSDHDIIADKQAKSIRKVLIEANKHKVHAVSFCTCYCRVYKHITACRIP